MGDQKLRDLERRWQETGSPDDEAAYLLERVRLGGLTRHRLELAAYCGHEGASRAISQRSLQWPVSVEAWIEGLDVFGGDVVLEGCQALAQEVLRASACREEHAGTAQGWLRRSAELLATEVPAAGRLAFEVSQLRASPGATRQELAVLELCKAVLLASVTPSPARLLAYRISTLTAACNVPTHVLASAAHALSLAAIGGGSGGSGGEADSTQVSAEPRRPG